jgi:hypothetical protein
MYVLFPKDFWAKSACIEFLKEEDDPSTFTYVSQLAFTACHKSQLSVGLKKLVHKSTYQIPKD